MSGVVAAERDRPASGSGVGFGLEAWLSGTAAELDAAERALAGVGAVRWSGIGEPGRRVSMAGADAGRLRTYLLLWVSGGSVR